MRVSGPDVDHRLAVQVDRQRAAAVGRTPEQPVELRHQSRETAIYELPCRNCHRNLCLSFSACGVANNPMLGVSFRSRPVAGTRTHHATGRYCEKTFPDRHTGDRERNTLPLACCHAPRRRSALLARLVVDTPGRPQIILGELRRVILDGAVPPRTVIPLREVAELFGVSHIPVREALKTLIGEGLVTHEPHAGYTVAQLTAAELREMYIARQTLETASLAAAAMNHSAADRAELLDVTEALEQAIRDDDPAAYHRGSRAFHVALTRPSRMFRLLHMLEAAWNVTEPVQSMVHIGRADRVRLHTDHALMLDAFLARDVERLLLVAEHHHRRLESVIATLPTDTGLLAPEDISAAQ